MKKEELEVKKLPLNIQLFAEEGKDSEKEDKTDVADDSQDKSDNSENKSKNSKQKDEPEKKYTDDDVNNISKKNVDKATKKLMKDLGIEDVEEAKTILANARAEKEKNKTAEDKANDLTKNLSEKDKELDKKNRELVGALLENRLMRQGVDSTKIERAVKMIPVQDVLNEDGEVDNDLMTSEIEKLLKDFPEFKTKTDDENKSKGFKFGSNGEESKEKSNSGASQVPTKRWNRFRI